MIIYRPAKTAEVRDADDANRDANDANRDANDANRDADEVVKSIIEILMNEPSVNQYELAAHVDVSRATLQRTMKKMTENGLITRVGSTRGYWRINLVGEKASDKKGNF